MNGAPIAIAATSIIFGFIMIPPIISPSRTISIARVVPQPGHGRPDNSFIGHTVIFHPYALPAIIHIIPSIYITKRNMASFRFIT